MKWLRPLLLAALVAIATPAAAVISFIAMRDANLTIPQDTVSVVTINAFSAARTLTIPNPGQTSIGQSGPATYYQNALSIYDAAQGITASNTLTIQAASGTINGSATLVVTVTGATINLIPTSGSNWQATVLSASGATITPTTCTNQFVRAIASSGAATCATVNATNDVTAGILAPANGGTGVANSFNTTVTSATSIGAGQYLGVAAATAATAGNIGQLISATVVAGSAVSLTTNTAATVTSVSLTAGEWDVSASVHYTIGGTTTVGELDCSTSLTTNVFDTTVGITGAQVFGSPQAIVINPTDPAIVCPVRRVSFGSTTSVFLIAFSTFGVSTNAAYGFIRATRVH